MDSETAEALEASIEHWKRNAAAETPDAAAFGVDHCALCKKFVVDRITDRCVGCPVQARTDRPGCDGSPYDDAIDAHDDWEKSPFDILAHDDFRTAALDEVAFLESLRDPK